MAFKISEDCFNCAACEPLCPNGAISVGESIFVIDPDKCTECKGYYVRQRCADVCWADSCLPDPAHVETEEQLLAKKSRITAGV